APAPRARGHNGSTDDNGSPGDNPTPIDCPPTGVLCTPECGPDGRLNGAPCRPGRFNTDTCSCDPLCQITADQAGCTAGQVLDPETWECEPIPCGGLPGTACPPGWTCQDDRSDDCDPAEGGADCSGVCVPQMQCSPTGVLCTPECGADGR